MGGAACGVGGVAGGVGVCEVWGSGKGGVEAKGWCEECNCQQKVWGLGMKGWG